MATTRERIKNNAFYEAYKIFIKDDKTWNKYNNILESTNIECKIGNESKYSEIFRGHIITNINQKYPVSIKKIPLSIDDLQLFLQNQHNNRKLIFCTKTIWREIYLLKMCTKLVKLKKSIHLPLHFFNVYSGTNNWNKSLSKNGPHMYCYNELAKEDLKSWSSKPRSYNEFISCFLQIYFALYVLQHYLGFLHNDLHWGNVLVFPIKKGGSWTYVIHGEEYHIPNEGFLFVVWDFGMASLHNPLRECGDHIKSCQDFLKILNTPKWIIKHYPSISVPNSISDLCLHIRSMEYKSMKELLSKVIQKFCRSVKNFTIETFTIGTLTNQV